MPYRILVTGSRNWTDEPYLWTVLDLVGRTSGHTPEDCILVSGHCPTGADRMAEEWAVHFRVHIELHPADWSQGKGAGFKRNKEMVDLGADICIAFILDESKGATHTRNLAVKAGIKTQTYERESDPNAPIPAPRNVRGL